MGSWNGVPRNRARPPLIGCKALQVAAGAWLITAIIGQWIFFYYIAVHYGGSAAYGRFADWTHASIIGYAVGDVLGNMIFASHILLAAIISFGGVLQLVPALRKRWPSFHRWNGRLFIIAALMVAVGGLYLVWVRGATTTSFGAVAISGNGLLMALCAVMAWRTARARRFIAHRRWAIHLFMQASGVWFFRLGLMAWIFANGGPVGIGDKFDGPFIMVWSFGNFLVPMAIAEIYLRVDAVADVMPKVAIAALMFLLTILTAFGIFAAFVAMWRPFL